MKGLNGFLMTQRQMTLN